MPEPPDLYRVLQVDPAADPLVIQAAYRVLARIFHPDVEGDAERMKRINEAWEVLGDPRRRARYDLERAGRHPGPSVTAAASGSAAAAARQPATPPADHAGPPVGEPSGPVMRYGRYEGWSLGQIARIDRTFLEWLRRVPAGRGLRDDIDAALRGSRGARTLENRRTSSAESTPDRVHAWSPATGRDSR
jgi:curved DNA-binding protein CbpA